MYDESTLAAVRSQLNRVTECDLYADMFAEAGINPGDIDSWEDFREVPFLTGGDLKTDYNGNAPAGSLRPK